MVERRSWWICSKVFKTLRKRYADKIPLTFSNSVIFDDGKTHYKGSIVEALQEGSWCVRFRNDKFGYFNSDVINFLPEFYELIKENTIKLKLLPNTGYIVNNEWFLHGRQDFLGQREMWRLLIYDNFLPHRGFVV